MLHLSPLLGIAAALRKIPLTEEIPLVAAVVLVKRPTLSEMIYPFGDITPLAARAQKPEREREVQEPTIRKEGGEYCKNINLNCNLKNHQNFSFIF